MTQESVGQFREAPIRDLNAFLGCKFAMLIDKMLRT
jgi:hypothetical protein